MKLSLPLLSSVIAAFLAFGGCSSSKDSAATGKQCEPGKDYHCQCVNKDEGTHTCNEDGQSFTECLPCYGDQVISDDDVYVTTDDDGSNYEQPDDAGTLDATVSAGCGNGIAETGEQCDDKNLKDSDGCSKECKVEGKITGTNSCPGLSVHVWNDPVTFEATTTGFPNRHTISPSCTGYSGSSGLDRTFAVTAHKTGTLTLTVSNLPFEALLYYSTKACSDTNPMSYDACAYGGSKTSHSLSFSVTSGTSYVVVVDAGSAKQGAFTASFEIK